MLGVISIMVLDDQPVVQEALRRSPDIVLTDVRMSGVGGIEVTRQIKQKFPSAKVIMLSFYDEYMPEAIEPGGDGNVQLGEVVISGRLLAPSPNPNEL